MDGDELLASIHQIANFTAYDQEDVELYSHAIGYKLALYDLETRFRTDNKWGTFDENTMKYIESLRDFMGDLKIQYHLPED